MMEIKQQGMQCPQCKSYVFEESAGLNSGKFICRCYNCRKYWFNYPQRFKKDD